MTKVKKNKMKTHKGMKKVFKVRKSGSIAIPKQGTLHNTGKRSTKDSIVRYTSGECVYAGWYVSQSGPKRKSVIEFSGLFLQMGL